MGSPVVVAGGGLAGLTAAARLAEAGHEVTLFERRPTLGGRVRSREVEGFTLDRGFQVLFTAYPAARRELDYDALDFRAFSPGATIARPGRRSTLADPLREPRTLLASALNPEVTLADKLRTLWLRRELAGRPGAATFAGPDRSVEAYLRDRGFSEAFRRRFAAPFYGGITLDRSLSTSKRVFEYTFARLSEGATVLPADGMGAIPAQLADRARAAGVTLHTGEPVTAVRVDADGAGRADANGGSRGAADGPRGTVTVETADRTVGAAAAVVATDPPAARELTGVRSIPADARPCVTQYYALDTGLDAGRRLLLNAAGPRPNTVVPLSAVAPEYAPAGRELLCATFLGEAALEEPAPDLAGTTREALRSWFPDRRFDGLERLATDRIEFAQFAQPPGCHESLPGVRAPEGPVYLAGEFTEWSAIQGALASGATAAEAVRADLA